MFRFPQSNFDVHSSVLPRIAMPLLAGLLLVGLNISQPRADDRLGPHEFIIPASDGYGTSECLSQQSTCGQAIAVAWSGPRDRLLQGGGRHRRHQAQYAIAQNSAGCDHRELRPLII